MEEELKEISNELESKILKAYVEPWKSSRIQSFSDRGTRGVVSGFLKLRV